MGEQRVNNLLFFWLTYNWLHLGDIVGCGIDLENEIIEFWINGQSLGIAFKGIFNNKQNKITKLVYPALSYSIPPDQENDELENRENYFGFSFNFDKNNMKYFFFPLIFFIIIIIIIHFYIITIHYNNE